MRKLFLYSLLCLIITSCSTAQNKDKVFKKVWQAVGGKSVFEKSRYFQFDFAVERDGKTKPPRKHLWDRYTGDYRLETQGEDGVKNTVLFNVNDKKGVVYFDGIKQEGLKEEEGLKKAYAAFINDTYWLMIPLKLQDDGVNTILESNEEIKGIDCHTIHLNFDKVGLTPGDQYWLYVNSKSGEIIRWKFLLQNQKKESVFDWAAYEDLGNGLKLSNRKVNINGENTIYYPVAKVLQEVDKNIFTQP